MPAVEGATKTILVVEDNAAARESLAAVLRRHGFAVTLAGDGRQALELLGAGPTPDLILLDMFLPVLDGWHVLDGMKGLPAGVPERVVITTGTILSREWADAHGCAGFLKKPFGEAELLAELDRVFGRCGGGVAGPTNTARANEER